MVIKYTEELRPQVSGDGSPMAVLLGLDGFRVLAAAEVVDDREAQADDVEGAEHTGCVRLLGAQRVGVSPERVESGEGDPLSSGTAPGGDPVRAYAPGPAGHNVERQLRANPG